MSLQLIDFIGLSGIHRLGHSLNSKDDKLLPIMPMKFGTPFGRSVSASLLSVLLIFSGCNKDPKKFIAKGDQSFAQAKYADAMIFYGRALQLDPRSADAHYKMAQTNLRMKSWGAAYAELVRTIELQPENWQAQLDLGHLELAGGHKKEANDRAKLILKSSPESVEAQLLLADSEAALGNISGAIEEAQSAVKMSPDRALPYVNLAQLLLRSGNTADAETNFLKAEGLDPKSPFSFLALGALYFQQKEFSDAEKQFSLAISAAPDDPSPRASLAGFYFSQNQTDKAEQVLIDAKNQLASNPLAYRMLGDSYLSRGLTDKALAEFSSLSSKYPNDVPVQKSYVQLLILVNRLQEAGQLDDALLKKAPQDAEALVLKGQLQIRAKKYDDALSSLQAAVKSAPENAPAHYQLGVVLAAKDSLQQAEAEWHEASRLRPNYVEPLLALSKSATQKGDWKDLEDLSSRIKKYAPNSQDGYLFHATARMNQGDPLGAEADLMNLQRIAPQGAAYYVKMGELRAAQKKAGEAEGFYKQALQRDPNSVEAVVGMVKIYAITNRLADAGRLVEEQIKHNPESPTLYLIQAEIQFQQKQNQLAEASLNRVLELDKSNVQASLRLAQLYEATGQLDKAANFYQRSFELAPRNIRPLVSLGELQERMGNWQQAQANYQKALAIVPEDPIASNNLAYLLLEHGGSPTLALTLAQAARKGMPNLPNSADTLGWAYFNNNAYSVAAPLLESAVKATPNNQTYRFHLGMTYQKLNDPARAKVEFEKVISLNPNSQLADQARRFL